MKVEYVHWVRSASSREGARIHLAVLHDTEGSDHPEGNPSADLVGLGALFDNVEASAHYAVNVEGRFGQYVPDSAKAWSNCNFNPVSISLEQIGFASWTTTYWMQHRHTQLKATARWLLYVHNHYGVPLRKGEVSGGGVVKDGIVQHKDLGLIGCGHSDCGDGYPIDYVILLARLYSARAHEHKKLVRKLREKVNAWRRHYGILPHAA